MSTSNNTFIIINTSINATLYVVNVHYFISILFLIAVCRFTRCVKLQNCFEIVVIQNVCFVFQANTSMFQKFHDENFVITLIKKFNALDVIQIMKKIMYRQIVEK